MAIDWQAKLDATRAKWREADRKFWRSMIIMEAESGLQWEDMSKLMSRKQDRLYCMPKSIVSSFLIVTLEALHEV